MRILHISDLHVTGRTRQSADIWHPLAEVLAERGHTAFDAVVISGDLTQRGNNKDPEIYGYKDLMRDLKTHILKLVGNRREAVVLVPGNHDVDWTWVDESKSTPFVVPKTESGKPAWQWDSKSNVRPDGEGRKGYIELKTSDYGKRFAPFQEFYSRFYRSVDRSKHRPMITTTSELLETLRPATSGHWSAHVFHTHRVIMVGFNSCEVNDKYWRGALISQEALEGIRQWIEKRKLQHFRRIAVWHHGIYGRQGQRDDDFLSIESLNALHSAGFRLGFHGHTHAHRTRIHLQEGGEDDKRAERLVVIGAGSLAAGANEMPEGERNQFSIVDLRPNGVRIASYVLQDGSYRELNTARQVPFRSSPLHGVDWTGNFADTHRRHVHIDADAVATMKVSLTDAQVNDPIVLAAPRTGVGRVVGEGTAEVRPDRSGPTLHEHVLAASGADGAAIFTVGTQRRIGPKICHLEWNYVQANAFATNQAELVMFPASESNPRSEVAPDGDAVSHVVRIASQVLMLAVSYEEAAIVPGSAAIVVHEPSVDAMGHTVFRRLAPHQMHDAAKIIKATARHIEARIPGPVLGFRYSLMWNLKKLPTGNKTWVNSDATITRLRAETLQNWPVVAGVTGAIEAAMLDLAKKYPIGNERQLPAWRLYLWSQPELRLFPVAGRLPHNAWENRFSFGSGLVGHCFRVASPISWSRVPGFEDEGCIVRGKRFQNIQTIKAQIAWIPKLPNATHAQVQYDWSLAVPVKAGKSVYGVFGVSGHTDCSDWSAFFRECAVNLTAKRRTMLERFGSDIAAAIP